MAAGASVWIEDKALLRMLKSMTEEVPGGRKGHRNAHVKKFIKDAYAHLGNRFKWRGVDENDRKGVWPELAEKTKKEKERLGIGPSSILMWTGKLAMSVKIRVAKQGRYLVQDAPAKNSKGYKYYWTHHFGDTTWKTSKKGTRYKVVIPQRRLLLWTNANREQLKRRLIEWFAAVTKNSARKASRATA